MPEPYPDRRPRPPAQHAPAGPRPAYTRHHQPPTWTPPPQPPQPQYGPPLVPPPRRRRRVWPWVVLAVVVLGFGGCAALLGAAGSAVSTATGPVTVRYELAGDGQASAVTWSGDNAQVAQQAEADLPWSKEVTFQNGLLAAAVLSGQRGSGSGEISCKVTDVATGKVLAENRSSGPYSVVSCTGMRQ